MYRIFVAITLLAAANAGEYQATSYSSYNDNHNSVHHFNSAPASSKYQSLATHAYSAPAPTVVKYAAQATPVYEKYAVPAASSYFHAPQYSVPQYSAPTAHAAPAVALPVIAKVPLTKYVAAPSYSAHQEEYAPAKYEFVYSIEEPHTGDFHSQQEQRDGDHVVGQYSLHEADGTVRIVKYSDEGHGFNAVVENQGHPTEAPVVHKKVITLGAPQHGHYYH